MADEVAIGGSVISRSFLLLLALVCYGKVESIFIRNATASSTCGNPPEQFFESWQVDLNPRLRVPFVCNSSDPLNQHSIYNVIDGSANTFWQSTAGVENVEITLDISSATNQVLFIKAISIAFGSSQRPGQIEFLRSVDGGRTFTTWQYVVSLPFECQSVFGVEYMEKPFEYNTVLCTKYPSVRPESANESLTLDLESGRKMSGAKLQNWLKASIIKMKFSGLYKMFDIFSQRWHHYNVREIDINATCFCNGHASTCVDPNNNGTYQCECENNACGSNCQQCCPAFNQHQWKPGSGNPFEVDNGSACEACNCHNHSTICYYNQTTAVNQQSLDVSGNYSGGGVCVDCLHNTKGINCQECTTFYFNPRNISKFAVDACKSCNCSASGSRLQPGFHFLDCSKNDSVSDGMLAGDCFCKQNVKGSKCDTCTRGFFNLTQSNGFGCQECQCITAGTKDGDISCSENLGKCNCKNHTTGDKCSECKDQYFNLTSSNDEGCLSCACNGGGSSSLLCNKQNGSCICHANTIIGRQCDQLQDEFYYPALNFIMDNVLVRSNRVVMAWRGTLPAFGAKDSNEFRFAFECTSTVSVDAVIDIVYNDKVISDRIKVDRKCVRCFIVTEKVAVVTRGQVSIDITFPSVTTNLVQCFKLIGVPKQFYDSTALSNREEFYSHCDVLRNNVSHPICQRDFFTLTMDYLHQPFPCQCSAIGSIDNNCQKRLGQCRCKPGVTGRTCDSCQPGFFNITENGCSPCGCFGNDKECHQTTGQCNCEPNTVGLKCDSCEPYHWNITRGVGCVHCNCSSTGAMNGECDTITGQCQCRSGVQGRGCDQCLPGFKFFSMQGCQSCNCSSVGSISEICNVDSGQCLCKNKTTGIQCDRCQPGTFYLNGDSDDGCLDCYCSGVSKNCSTGFGTWIRQPVNLTQWKLYNEDNSQEFNTYIISRLNSSGSTFYMMSAPIISHRNPLYWRYSEDFFNGQGVLSYGGIITFYVEISINAARYMKTFQPKIILHGYNGQEFVQYFKAIQPNTITNVTLQIHESYWTDNKQNRSITRIQLLEMLSDDVSVSISASPMRSSDFGYIVRISEITFHALKLDGRSSTRSSLEVCTCPNGYTGTVCQQCQDGYHHIDAGNGTRICVKCRCNNHATECDKETGNCIDCQDDTTGHNCNLCQSFYYGNATDQSVGCTKCPCQAPNTRTGLCEQIFGIIRCLNCSVGYTGDLCSNCSKGYYKDQFNNICLPCQCNNNTDECLEQDGSCINCRFNTTGRNCQVCLDGWYGNAVNQTCQACQCNVEGSLDKSCDDNGQCSCKNNVVGKDCSQCAPRSYGFNNKTGCEQCQCNQIGSSSLQCADNGNCSCVANATRMKCDRCQGGLWGLPDTSCQECYCNMTGSVNISCTSTSGKCYCQPGVNGRQCDSCMKLHYDFSNTGCTDCHPCEHLLQKKVDYQISVLKNLKDKSTVLYQVDELIKDVQSSSATASNVQNLGQVFEAQLQALQKQINNMKSNALRDSVDNLEMQTSEIRTNISTLRNLSSVESARIENIVKDCRSAFDVVLDANTSSSTTRNNLDGYLTISSSWLDNIKNTTIGVPSFNISDQTLSHLNLTITNASELTSKATNELSSLQQRLHEVLLNVTAQNETTYMLIQQYPVMTNKHNRLSNNFTDQKSSYDSMFQVYTSVLAKIASVKTILERNNETLMEMQDIISNTSSAVVNAQTSLKESHVITMNINSSLAKGLVTTLQKSISNLPIIPKTLLASLEHIAGNMTQYANDVVSIFKPAEDHGKNALRAVELYDEIQKSMNSTEEIRRITNTTTEMIKNLLSENHLMTLSDNITKGGQLNAETQENLKSRESLLSDLSEGLAMINQTSINATEAVNRVFKLYPQLISVSSTNEYLAEYIDQMTGQIRQNTSETMKLIDSQNSTMVLWDTIYKLSQQLNETMERNHSVTNLIEKGLNASVKISATLDNSSTILQHIDDSMKMRQEVNSSNDDLQTRLQKLRERLLTLKSRIGEIEAPVAISRSDSPIQFTKNVTIKKDYFEFTMKLKTEKKNALLMTIGAAGQDGFVKASIGDSRLAVDYVTLEGNYQNKNWEIDVSDNSWKQFHFTRINNSSRLTVTSLDDDVTQTYGKFSTRMNVKDVVHQTNAVPFSVGSQNVGTSFEGCLSSLRINNLPISLLQGNITGRTICNSSSNVKPTKDYGVSFSGHGFIQQNMSDFNISGDFKIEITFSTFKKNGSLMKIVDTQKNPTLSIDLLDGNLLLLLTSNSSSFFLRSKNSIYANGNTFKLLITRWDQNITMIIHNNTSQIMDHVTINDGALKLYGTHFYFGGNENSTQSQFFSGCIEGVKLAAAKHARLKVRPLTIENSVVHKEVNFAGCFMNAEEGVHFEDQSYSKLTLTAGISSVKMIFKTSRYTGVLLSLKHQNKLFYLSLLHGNIFMSFDGQSVYTTDQTFNNRVYHTIEVAFTTTKITLNIDENYVMKNISIPATDFSSVSQMAIGTSSELENELVPVAYGLIADYKVMEVNGQSVMNLLLGNAQNVFTGGVSPPLSNPPPTRPATIPPTTLPPPSCAAELTPLMNTNNTNWIGFHGDSLLALYPVNDAEKVRNVFAVKFVITLEFRSILKYGVLLFASNQKTGNEFEYVAVELDAGQIVYHYNSGPGIVKMRTNTDYATGEWIKVYFIRINQFGAMMVSNTQEYRNDNNQNKFDRLDIELPVYLGGIPSYANTTVLLNPISRFHGCIRKFEIDETESIYNFNLINDALKNQSHNLRPCYSSVKPQLSFRGDGFAQLHSSVRTSLPFSLEMTVRLTSKDGVFWEISDGVSHLVLLQVQGRVELLRINNGVAAKYFSWQDENLLHQNVSYALCDGRTKEITVDRIGNFFRLFVDKLRLVVSSVAIQNDIVGNLYVAGSPTLSSPPSSYVGLSGCIENMRYNNQDMNLGLVSNSTNIDYGCGS